MLVLRRPAGEGHGVCLRPPEHASGLTGPRRTRRRFSAPLARPAPPSRPPRPPPRPSTFLSAASSCFDAALHARSPAACRGGRGGPGARAAPAAQLCFTLCSEPEAATCQPTRVGSAPTWPVPRRSETPLCSQRSSPAGSAPAGPARVLCVRGARPRRFLQRGLCRRVDTASLSLEKAVFRRHVARGGPPCRARPRCRLRPRVWGLGGQARSSPPAPVLLQGAPRTPAGRGLVCTVEADASPARDGSRAWGPGSRLRWRDTALEGAGPWRPRPCPQLRSRGRVPRPSCPASWGPRLGADAGLCL